MIPPVCEDCARGTDLEKAEVKCYAFCTRCGIKRVCFGDDPEPLAHRGPRRLTQGRAA